MKARRTAPNRRAADPLRGYSELRKEVLLRFQTDYVWQLLIAAKGNVSLAARMAKIDRKQLWRLIRKTGIRIERQETDKRRRGAGD